MRVDPPSFSALEGSFLPAGWPLGLRFVRVGGLMAQPYYGKYKGVAFGPRYETGG